MNRREFFAAIAAGAVVTAEGLWLPGSKLISIPSGEIFIPEGTLAWMEGDLRMIYMQGAAKALAENVDLQIIGGELRRVPFAQLIGRV